MAGKFVQDLRVIVVGLTQTILPARERLLSPPTFRASVRQGSATMPRKETPWLMMHSTTESNTIPS